MKALRTGLLTKKIGMTRILQADGRAVPVTVLQLENASVVTQMTKEKNGYTAVQIGAFNQKKQRLSKAMQSVYAKAGQEPKAKLVEFRVSEANLLAAGTQLKADHFAEGQFVDVTGTTKGHGMTGAMKRWNFGGGRASHGNSLSHRILGGTAGRQDPGKVMKNKKMHGHDGNASRTTQNLQVVRVDAAQGLIMLKGAVPGARNSYVLVRDAIKAKATKAAK